MREVLVRFSRVPFLSPQLAIVIKNIGLLFDQFRSSKEDNVDGWECLFVIVLLIRVATGLFENTILPLKWPAGTYSFSYNAHTSVHGFDTDLDAYLNSMAQPKSVPHVAIYYPQPSPILAYDVIVAVYEANRERHL
jgi:hypothetical protein